MALDSGPSGPAWLATENIEVEIAQLDDFANAIQQELEQNFLPSFQEGIVPVLAVQAPFGQGGLLEGKFFGGQHKQNSDSLRELLVEAGKGLTALHMAARAIAAEYRTGDALAEAGMNDVLDGFTGRAGEPTLQSVWQEQASSEPTADGEIPVKAQNPADYFTGDDAGTGNGERFDPYAKEVVAEGEKGQLTIPGDHDRLNDPKYNPDTTFES